MKVYTVRVLLNDIVAEIQEKKILNKPSSKIRDFIKKKINSYLVYFCENNCKADGLKIKNLGSNIFELRIVLNSNWLLRVLFLQEGSLFLLFVLIWLNQKIMMINIWKIKYLMNTKKK